MKYIYFIALLPFIFGSACKKNKVKDTLSDGLIAYYPLNGTVLDSSGNSLHGINEFVSFVVDRLGKTSGAGDFNGKTSSMVVKNASALNLSNDFTIATWFKADTIYEIPGTVKMILSKNRNGNATTGFAFGLWNNSVSNVTQGIVNFSAAPNFTTITYPTANTGLVQVNRWYHSVCTYEKASGKFVYYINGSMVDQKSLVFSNVANDFDFLIGAEAIGVSTKTNYFNGALDEIRIYNRVLTNAEITKLSK